MPIPINLDLNVLSYNGTPIPISPRSAENVTYDPTISPHIAGSVAAELASQSSQIGKKYSKPSGGIPDSDLASTFLKSADISGKENTSNKVTSISSSSTDTEYPSAKCVYSLVGDIESALAALR